MQNFKGGGCVMSTIEEARNLEITLIKLMEAQSINKDDYNLIHKYLVKLNNDLKLQANLKCDSHHA